MLIKRIIPVNWVILNIFYLGIYFLKDINKHQNDHIGNIKSTFSRFIFSQITPRNCSVFIVISHPYLG